jgi:hypothetical protein
MLETSEFATANPKAVKEILISVCNILFGMAKDSISSDLVNISFKAISDKFVGITIQDVKNAYQDVEIDKKQYVSLTRDELILPIKTYWAKKMKLLAKIKDIELESEKEKYSEAEKERFEFESMRIFSESLEQKKWIGTPVNAYSVLSQQKAKGTNEVAGKFSDQQKKEIYEKCVRENESAKHVDIEKCDKIQVIYWLEMLQNPKWIFANELMKMYFDIEHSVAG